MDDTMQLLVELVCEVFGLSRTEFMEIVKEEAEAAGLMIKEEVLTCS